jgi:CDP-glycerol glycerophosphotransferase (TagB/SpsB family)
MNNKYFEIVEDNKIEKAVALSFSGGMEKIEEIKKSIALMGQVNDESTIGVTVDNQEVYKHLRENTKVQLNKLVVEQPIEESLMLNLALYFYGGMAEVYQLEQWLEVIEELHKVEPLCIIVRNENVAITLRKQTDISIIYFDTINELLTAYEESEFKTILYVNNGMKNFQSLIYHRALHIHVNHGESEKSSMHSNQCKSYDYTYVVGEAAYDRYKRHIINIESANYVKIGRPQFDYIKKVQKNFDRKVVLYAPTDESTHISMRYTSIERLGLKIVNSILENSEYQLVYRPHPSTGKNSKIVAKINAEIIKKVEESENGTVEKDLNAIDLLSVVDLAIFDNSSLIIDFLNFDKPMFATNMFMPEYHDIKPFKMLKGCTMLDEENIDDLNQLITEQLENDPLKEQRIQIREYYLGNYKKGESTKFFIKKVLEVMDERDRLLDEKGMLDTIH